MTFSYFDVLFEMKSPTHKLNLALRSFVSALWLFPSALTHPIKTKRAESTQAYSYRLGAPKPWV